ncbi:MAG: hypothetical protein Sapg2KO_27740 [Saprospiraceae bacterium]
MKLKIILSLVIITFFYRPVFGQRIFDLKTNIISLISDGSPNLGLEVAGPKQSIELAFSYENRKRVLFQPDNSLELDFFNRRLLLTDLNYRFYVLKSQKRDAAGFFIGPSARLELEVSGDDTYFTEKERRFGADAVEAQQTLNFLGLGAIGGFKFPVYQDKLFIDVIYTYLAEINDGDPTGMNFNAFMGINLAYRF